MDKLKTSGFKSAKNKNGNKNGNKNENNGEKEASEKSERGEQRKNKFLIEAGVGALGGFINGFFGGGGGMIIVPLLIYVLKYERKTAHASCIAVILPVSIVSGIIYLFGGKLNGFNLLPASLGVFIGGIAGALLLKKIKAEILGYAFCLIMAIAGLKMIF